MTTDKTEQEGEKSVVKEISVMPVLTNLLKPTAEMLGQELKGYVKEKIDSWKDKKREENVAEHVRQVHERIINEKPDLSNSKESIRQFELFEEWVEGAQEVDPSEETLARMWQELLYKIAQGKNFDVLLIEKLKLIDTDQAAVLLGMYNKPPRFIKNKKDRYLLHSLEKLGLVERTHLRTGVFALLGAWPVAVMAAVLAPEFMNIIRMESLILINFLFFFLAVLAPFVIILSKNGFAQWRLSWIGSELSSRAKTDEE